MVSFLYLTEHDGLLVQSSPCCYKVTGVDSCRQKKVEWCLSAAGHPQRRVASNSRFYLSYFGNRDVSSLTTVADVAYEFLERLFNPRVEAVMYPTRTYLHQNSPFW